MKNYTVLEVSCYRADSCSRLLAKYTLLLSAALSLLGSGYLLHTLLFGRVSPLLAAVTAVVGLTVSWGSCSIVSVASRESTRTGSALLDLHTGNGLSLTALLCCLLAGPTLLFFSYIQSIACLCQLAGRLLAAGNRIKICQSGEGQ